jgi:uncharacterized membrane-anchored protein YhcB (DUF1043 family)
MPDEPTMTAHNVDISEYKRSIRQAAARKDELNRMKAEMDQLHKELVSTKAERDEFADALVSLGDSHEQLESQLNAAPNELQARIAELEKELTVRDRTAEFHKLAKEKGIKDEHFEAASKLMGWKPDADDYDPAKLGESIGALAGQYAFLLGDAATAAPAAAASSGNTARSLQVQPRPPGPGSTRGALPTVSARDTDAELAQKYPDASRLA